eukprot:UN24904
MATKLKIVTLVSAGVVANSYFEPHDYEKKNWLHRFTNFYVFPVLIPSYKPTTETFAEYQLRLLQARADNMKRMYAPSN